MRLTCPKCGSRRIIYAGMSTSDAGGYGVTDQRYTCKDCSYSGALIIDAEKRDKDKLDLAMEEDLNKVKEG